MEKLVSVIVPIYNVERYIEKCVTSILEQKYKNIELILVDDGSTDESGKIIDALAKKDKRINVIHKANGGVSSARNSGLDTAKGEYVCFVDGDDYVMEDYITYMYDMIERNKSDIAISKLMFSNFDNSQIKEDVYENVSGETAAIEIMTYNIPIGVYCKLFNREFLNKNNIRFFQDIYIGEGFNFNVKAFQLANKVSIGKRKIYYYRRDNEKSATTSFSKEKWENGLLAMDVMKKFFSIKSRKTIKAWKFAYWRTNVDVYSLLVTSNTYKKYDELYKRCKKIGKRNWYYAFITPTAYKEKLRAISMLICPPIIPYLVIKRRKKYSVNIEN